MHTLSKLSAKLQAKTGRAQLPPDVSAAKVEDFCKMLLEVAFSCAHNSTYLGSIAQKSSMSFYIQGSMCVDRGKSSIRDSDKVPWLDSEQAMQEFHCGINLVQTSTFHCCEVSWAPSNADL